MASKEQLEKFASVLTDRRPHRLPWNKQAMYVLRMKKAAADALDPTLAVPSPAAGARDNDDIVRNMLDVHQQQQATVAAAENESRSLRQQLDDARGQLGSLTQTLQQQQAQLQQTQAQAQQAMQQTQMQAQQATIQAGAQAQQAQAAAQSAQQEATIAKSEAVQQKEHAERIRQAVMDYKSRLLDVISQDPVTLAAAQEQLQRQQQMSVMQAQGAAMQMQQAAAAEQQAAQAQQTPQEGGGGEGQNQMGELARAVAGQGERAGMRRAMAESMLGQQAQQGAAQGQGGMQVPPGSLAETVLKQGAALQQKVAAAEKLDLLANKFANDLRIRQGSTPRPPDGSVKQALLEGLVTKVGQVRLSPHNPFATGAAAAPLEASSPDFIMTSAAPGVTDITDVMSGARPLPVAPPAMATAPKLPKEPQYQQQPAEAEAQVANAIEALRGLGK